MTTTTTTTTPNGKRPPLTVHTAEVNTVAVEIKTMTVTGRQVTLAVFRQLIEEPLILGDTVTQGRRLPFGEGELAGVPWGTVNYHPERCADSSPHLHVVWQKGNELRRATEYAHRYQRAEMAEIHGDVAHDWLRAAALAGWEPSGIGADSSRWDMYSRDRGMCDLSVRFSGGSALLFMPDDVEDYFRALHRARAHTTYPRALLAYGPPAYGPQQPPQEYETDEACAARQAREREEMAEGARTKLREAVGTPPDYDQALARVNAEIIKHLERRAVLAQRWAELEALPQLFIAV